MQQTNKKCHWFESTTGRQFYAVKALDKWRILGKKGFILYEDEYLSGVKKYVNDVFGWRYAGYM